MSQNKKRNFRENNSDSPFVVFSDDLSEDEMNKHRVQAMFKRSKHSQISIFTTTHVFYELPQKTIWANSNIYHIFKSNSFRDVQNLYQDKANMDSTLMELELSFNFYWLEQKISTSNH